jgi:hypothetical protein
MQINETNYFLFFRQAKVQDLDTYAFELLTRPESLSKKDILLNIVYDKDEDENYFQHQFEVHWPLKENVIAKYEYLEQHILNNLTSFMTNNLRYKNVSKQALKITLARYYPDRAQWIIIDPRTINSNKKNNKTSNTPTKSNLRLEPYRLTDLVVIGVLEGEHLPIEHFDTRYDQRKRKDIDYEKEQKKINRERNRTDNDRSQTNGSSVRRKSPQNTMRINVDDFES